jgi:putative ABC transport system permease protein
MRSSILKTAIRNLRKNKLLSFLNLTGLAAGFAVAILIFSYSYQEFQADKQYKKNGNIYVLMNNNSAHVQYEMASLLRDQVPGIKYVSMVESHSKNEFILKYKGNKSIRSDLVFADSNITKIFSFKLVSGDLEDALSTPRSIILTESESNRLFNDENPIGKILSLRGIYEFLGNSDVEVKAVIKDLPENSNLQFKAVVSHLTTEKMMPFIKECIWSCSNVQNYVLLQNGQDPKVLASHMNQQLRPLIPGEIVCNFSLLPYCDVYFSTIRDDFKHGNLKLIYTLTSIAVLILLIAVINYINLSMAGFLKRQTEIGVRKIVGVRPIQLIIQFLGESVLISFIAIIIGVFLAYLVTPSVNRISSIHLSDIPLSSIHFWLVLICCSIVIGIIAGFLPALSFNRFRPISLITGRPKSQNHGINLKRGLIVFQFVISIILIICTITITRQLNLLKNTNMGFNAENIVNIKLSPEVKHAVFKDKLQHNPGIRSVSFSRWFPGNIQENWQMTLLSNGVEKKVDFAAENADASYVDIMGLRIVQGRNFSDSLKSDIGSAIINEAAVTAFGLKNPLEAVFLQDGKIGKILGVIKDFNFESLHSQIRSLVIFYADQNLFSVNIKLSAGSFNTISKTLSSIEETWNEVSPNYPFEFKFIDQEIENLYKSEIVFEKIFRFGSFFAIFISCLGLFGLVLSSTGQRKKEIGIRKVYGARIGEVLLILNRDFIKWVLIAFIIASPVAHYLMVQWLKNFAYKISLSWWIFAFAGLLAIGIALLTVSWQSWKVAARNPVEALRYE